MWFVSLSANGHLSVITTTMKNCTDCFLFHWLNLLCQNNCIFVKIIIITNSCCAYPTKSCLVSKYLYFSSNKNAMHAYISKFDGLINLHVRLSLTTKQVNELYAIGCELVVKRIVKEEKVRLNPEIFYVSFLPLLTIWFHSIRMN